MTKRILSMLMSVIMLINMVPIAVGAVDAASFSASSAETYAGNTVKISVNGNNLTNLGSFELEIYYDSNAMAVSSASKGSLMGDSISDINTATAGVVKISAASLSGINGSGTLADISFAVKSDCTAGDYPVVVTVGEAYDTGLNAVSVSGGRGNICVKEKTESKKTFSLYTSATPSAVSKGDKLTYRINNNNRYGFASGSFTVDYDPAVLQVESVDINSNLKVDGCVYDINTNLLGRAKVLIASNVELNSYELITVTFTVIADADTTTTISTTASDMYADDLSEYLGSSSSRSISVSKLPEITNYPDLYLKNVQDMVVGGEYTTTLALEAGAPVAAADFSVSYDTSVFECIGVTASDAATADDAIVMINNNFGEGSIRFSYINQKGSADGMDLVDIVWKVKSAPAQHYTIATSASGIKDIDFHDIQLEFVQSTGCIYDKTITPPTCTEKGYTTFTCSCGNSYTDDYTDATGHTETVLEAVPPSCSATGLTEGVGCAVCGDIFSGRETIEKLPHTIGAKPTCTDPQICTVCGEELASPLGHKYSDDITFNGDGTKTMVCTVCGESKTEKDIVYQGTTGEDIYWFIDSLGTIWFEGTGAMSSVTWKEYIDIIKKAVVGEGITSLARAAFQDCKELTEAVLPSSLETISYHAFYGCDALETVNIPSAVVSIGDRAFTSTKIRNISFGDNLKTIGVQSFMSCSYIESITIPDSVTNINSYAFAYCSSLKTAVLPDKLITIPQYAFRNCSSLEEIYIPASVTTVIDSAFLSCSKLKYVYFSGAQEEWNAITIGSGNERLINATVFFNTCTDAHIWADATCAQGRHCTECDVTIGDALPHTEVADAAVAPNCTDTGLTEGSHCAVCKEVIVPQTEVPALGHSFTQYVLNGDGTKTAKCDRCDEYSTVNDEIYGGTYGENITWFIDSTDTLYINGSGEMSNSDEIPWNKHSTIIRKAVIDSTITTISNNAFAGCSMLEEIKIHDNITAIGSGAFTGCTSLDKIAIPDSVTSIGADAFDRSSDTVFIVNKGSAAHIWLEENNFTSIDVKVALEGISLPELFGFFTGESMKIVPQLYPEDATDKTNFVWTVADETVAVYNSESDCFDAIAPGQTTITVTDTISGFTASTTINVTLAIADLNGIKYTRLNEALEAAETEGGEIVLLCDAYEKIACLPSETTLDLNGNYLTTGNFLSFGDVIDTAEADKDGDGRIAGGIVISNKKTEAFTMLQPDNDYIPIYDTVTGCYRFYEGEVTNQGMRKSGTSALIGIRPVFNSDEAYDVLGNTTSPELKLNVTVAWSVNGSDKTYTYTVKDTTLPTFGETVAEQIETGEITSGKDTRKVVQITIRGLNTVATEGTVRFTSTAVLSSSTDATYVKGSSYLDYTI